MKDLSRLGRDHITVDLLVDSYSRAEIRFIAVDDNFDTINGVDEFLLPFRNILNELYAQDTSRKIHSVMKNKGLSGKHLATNPPYGYLKDPSDKDKWVVDPEAADVIRRIFKMAIGGMTPNAIARTLREEQVDMPGIHQAKMGQGVYALHKFADPYKWSNTVVSKILSRREYLGHTLNFKTKKHFKERKSHYVPESQWVEFPDTHEAIIDAETFQKAQEALKDQKTDRYTKRKRKVETNHPLSDIIFCSDCGSPLYYREGKPGVKSPAPAGFVCSGYMKRPLGKYCATSHCVNVNSVVAAVRNTLNALKAEAQEHGVRAIEDLYSRQTGDPAAVLNERLTEAKTKMEKSKGLMCRLYEDYAAGSISYEQFRILADSCESDIATTKIRICRYEEQLAECKRRSAIEKDPESLFAYICEYDPEGELDYCSLTEHIERIVVHERKEKYSRECGNQIDVIFR